MHHVYKALVLTLLFGVALPPCPVFGDDPRADEVRELQKKLQAELEAPAPKADITDSFASDFVTKVWNEPKHRYTLGVIAVGETLIAAALVSRARLNAKMWKTQIETGKDVALRLKEVTDKLAAAEGEVLKSLASLSQAERADLLKTLTEANKGVLPKIEAALKTEGAAASALSVEEATLALERAYQQWQQQAAAEARVLRAAGAVVESPASLAEVTAEVQQQVRAVTRLEFAQAQFAGYADAGVRHMMDKANLGLTKGIGWRGKLWRKTRMGLLLAAIPVVVVGVSIYFDREQERNRRIQDLNTSALDDREMASKTLIPYMGRPILFAFVKGWETSQAKDGSVLKRFRCPLEIKEIELQNESLPIIHALSLQVILEMQEAGEDVLEENGKKTPVITENFYKRLTLKVLEHKKSPLLQLKEGERKKMVADVAYQAYRAFDK